MQQAAFDTHARATKRTLRTADVTRIRLCRPSAHELLADPFLKKGIKNAKLVEALLGQVPSVGAVGSGGTSAVPPTLTNPVEVALVPGTTWVFPDELKAQLGIGGSDADGGGGAEGAGAGTGAGGASAGAGNYPSSGFGDEGDEDDTSMDAMQAALDAIGGENALGPPQ